MLWRLFASHLIAAVGSTKSKTVGHIPEKGVGLLSRMNNTLGHPRRRLNDESDVAPRS
jgi:hypothetical protein